MKISDQDREDLRLAKRFLEQPNIAVRLANALGYPIERGLAMLPGKASGGVHRVTRKALLRALQLAVTTLPETKNGGAANTLHRGLVAATGAAGGMAGLPALLVELPLSTTIMLRSIADIAQSEGEDVRALSGQLACLEVFALGGGSSAADAAETGYFAVRAALARGIAEAAKYIAERGLLEEGAPVIVRLVSSIASRFQVAVSEKLAAQAVPVIGAVGGALVNTVFMDHFQNMAHGHFAVRRLERNYGQSEVRSLYEALPAESSR